MPMQGVDFLSLEENIEDLVAFRAWLQMPFILLYYSIRYYAILYYTV